MAVLELSHSLDQTDIKLRSVHHSQFWFGFNSLDLCGTSQGAYLEQYSLALSRDWKLHTSSDEDCWVPGAEPCHGVLAGTGMASEVK